MANKHTMRCSTSLVIKEMHIKATRRFLFTPTRVARIKKTVTSVGEDVEKSGPSPTALGM